MKSPATFRFLEFWLKEPEDRLNAPFISRLFALLIEIDPVIVRLLIA